MSLGTDIVRRRFTLDEYHRKVDAGVLHEDDRVELIRGEIVQMSPIGSRHPAAVARFTDELAGRLRRRAILWPQNPVTILPDSEPQPDIVLLHYRDDFYKAALPGPADVALIVELADSSASYDRTVKKALYAEAGIAEYWLVNLAADRIEVYRDPQDGDYRHATIVGREDRLAPAAFPDVVLSVADILG
ncbi:MAG: Uma2 family endonuclease [Candidatus Rokubacteria bacterium]|nr:Uma2 family endonuclease [Candidatus Rokubacteria bacterium]